MGLPFTCTRALGYLGKRFSVRSLGFVSGNRNAELSIGVDFAGNLTTLLDRGAGEAVRRGANWRPSRGRHEIPFLARMIFLESRESSNLPAAPQLLDTVMGFTGSAFGYA
jgi:hypothetical protein